MPITVTGSDRLKRKFGDMAKVAQGRTLERALVAGALLMQNEAKRLAPKLTGNLSRSIHIGGHEDLNPGGQARIQQGPVYQGRRSVNRRRRSMSGQM